MKVPAIFLSDFWKVGRKISKVEATFNTVGSCWWQAWKFSRNHCHRVNMWIPQNFAANKF